MTTDTSFLDNTSWSTDTMFSKSNLDFLNDFYYFILKLK